MITSKASPNGDAISHSFLNKLLYIMKKDLNYCKLASISGVPYTTVKSIFYGQSKNPGIATIKKLCDGLEITVTEFFDTDYFETLEQEIK